MTEQIPPLPPLVPHLVVLGAIDAIAFYKKALGATEVMRMPSEDGKRLMHAHLIINGATIFLMDDFPELRGNSGHGDGKTMAPEELGGSSFLLHLEVPNCDEAVKRAVDAGAKVIVQPWDAFWGARYGEVRDPFGHGWSFGHPLAAKAG